MNISDLNQLIEQLTDAERQQFLASLISSAGGETQQVNLGNAKGFQVRVEGGTAYIGDIHIDVAALEEVLRRIAGDRIPKNLPDNLPVSNVIAFVGRATDLCAVDNLLRQNQQVNIAATIGMGGVGKTELALQYALQNRSQFSGGIVWLSGISPIAPQLIGFAESRLGLEVPESVEDAVGWCWQNWPGQDDVLVVVDDVQDYGALKPFLPSGIRFRVLLTTRQAILGVGQRLELEVLVLAAALDLLRGLVGDRRIDGELVAAGTLCEVLGRLPLGIELVGWYLAKRPDLTISQLLKRLDEKKLAAQALIQTYPEMTAKLGVAAAFELSWEPLGENAKTLAGLFGLFAAAIVEWKWVQDCFEAMEEEDLEDAQVELLGLHLLRRVDGGYQVHPLVREFFAVKLEELTIAKDLQGQFARGMVEIAKTIPQEVTVADRERLVAAVPHLEVVAANWMEGLEGAGKCWCCEGLARFYVSLSLWMDAERCRKKSLTISKEQLSDRHLGTASSLNNLAFLYNLMGRYDAAEPLYLEALEIRKEQLGDRHPDTAIGLNNLAGLYRSMGRYEEAEPLYLEAMEIWKEQLGDRHPDTASSLNNLALLYRLMKRYDVAEPLYLEAMEIRKEQLGDLHLDTASSLNNLAGLYRSMGRYEEAEPLYLEAMEIWKEQLGDRHPNTATSLFNLAALYHQTQQDQKALLFIREAIQIYIQTLGNEHPMTQDANSWLRGIQQAIANQ